MKIKHAYPLVLALLGAVTVSAQTGPASIAAVETQTPKPGMTQQYEQGRKQKADWHKQQKDPQPLYIYEILTGPQTGSYYVGRFDQHWADMDKPAIPDQSDTDEFNKVIGGYVQSVTAGYYEFLPKLSNRDTSSTTAKYYELATFHIRRDKITEFRAALGRIAEAAKKSQWPVQYEFYELRFGGDAGTFVLSEPHANWADFEEKPDVKPLRRLLEDSFGPAEADAIYGRLIGAIHSEDVEIIQFRADLSYIPAK